MTSALRLLALITLAGLLYMLLGPATTLEQGIPNQDKVAHFFAFGLILWTFGVLAPRCPRLILAASVILLGGATEIIQGYTGRDAEWLDFAADIAGVTVTLAVWSTWRSFRPGALWSANEADGSASTPSSERCADLCPFP